MRSLVIALILAAAGLGGLSLAAFVLAIRPPRITIPLTPPDVALRVEEVRVTAADGIALAGWLAARPGRPHIVLLHGYPAEKADLLPLGAALHGRFGVLLMDLRSFGQSGGRVTTLGLRERDDLRRTVDFLERRGLGPVGAFGFSLGGAVALVAAAEEARLRAVAAYAPFADLRDLGGDLYGWLGPLRRPFVSLMVLWGRLWLGADLTRPSPEQAARRLTIPVLLVHSRRDEQIPFQHGERLAAALGGNPRAEVVVLEHGRHGEWETALTRRLADFFERHLADRSPPLPGASR